METKTPASEGIPENTETTVIVVGCGTGGLAVIRSLGRRPGIRIIAASHKEDSVGFASKYVSERVTIPHAATQEEEFVEFFLSRGEMWKGAVIIEITDDAAIALAKHKKELSHFYKIVTTDWEVLQNYIKKSALYEFADECGVPHPRTFNPETPEECASVAEEVRYPCIIKPAYSHEFVSTFNCKLFHANDAEELAENFQKSFASGIKVMVQEIVVGPESNLERVQVYIDSKGNLTSRFFNNKLRQNPPDFGVMRVGMSVPHNPEVEELAEKMLTRGNYRGYASVEFKRDERDGQLNLIEINVRMPRNGWLAITSGVDFPWLVFSDLVYGESIEVSAYTENNYWIELFPELRNVIPKRGQKWMGFRNLLTPYFSKHRTFAVLSLRDPGPFLKQTLNAVRKLLRVPKRKHSSAETEECNSLPTPHATSPTRESFQEQQDQVTLS